MTEFKLAFSDKIFTNGRFVSLYKILMANCCGIVALLADGIVETVNKSRVSKVNISLLTRSLFTAHKFYKHL